jgi:hypothetical protein
MAGETVLRALRHVWLVLNSLNLPAAVAGGIAMAAWKYVRATRDVDVLIAIARERLDSLLVELRQAAVRPKRDPPLTALGRLDVVQLLYQPPETFVEIQIDLLVAQSPYYTTALQRRVATELPHLDIPIAVLACEDLVLHKLLAGRIIDRADAAALLRANRESLDLDYLLRWTANLELGRGLAQVWSEAFPEEPCPFQ